MNTDIPSSVELRSLFAFRNELQVVTYKRSLGSGIDYEPIEDYINDRIKEIESRLRHK